MANEIEKSNWLSRFLSIFNSKALKTVEDPKEVNRGAGWTSTFGISPTFSPRASMSVYGKHAYTHACVTRASQDIASLPIKYYRKDEQIYEDPFISLIETPNSQDNQYIFIEQLVVDIMMTGNLYVLIIGDISRPASLYRLHPEQVRIIPDPIKMIAGYEYSDGGSTVIYPPDRVIHIRSASWDIGARGELYGMGIVEALNEEITADLNAQRMASAVSKQGRPDVLLSPQDPADIWDKKTREDIMQSYRSMTKDGGAMALSGQIKVDTLALSPRDIEFQALRILARENISAVCGVPSTVLGLPDANYATARQSSITYWQIQKQRSKKIEFLLNKIARLFSPDLWCVIDFSEVDALQDMRSAQLQRVQYHILNGMSPADAYNYEGLDNSPFLEEVAVADTTTQSIDPTDMIARSIEQLCNTEDDTEDTLDYDDIDLLELEIQYNVDQKKNITIHKGSVGDNNPTNFPEDEDDKEVALRNSNYQRFPYQEALSLKEQYPEIWKRAGNILGNLQFSRLLPIAERSSSIAQTDTEELAIRLREAWGARHFEDYRLNGVVAQIKWLVVGSRGLSHMRKVISDEKRRLDAKKRSFRSQEQKDLYWHQWKVKALEPSQNALNTASTNYLLSASTRYALRSSTLINAIQNKSYEEKNINYSQLLGRAIEIKAIKDSIGRVWSSIWTLTGNDNLTELYGLTGKTRPLDLDFGLRSLSDPMISKMATEIVDTTEREVKEIVRTGIEEGLSNEQIAKNIKSATSFSDARSMMIAQTEATRSINESTVQSYQLFEKTENVQVMKEWISSRDGKVRDEHRELDLDAPIPVTQDFEVNGYRGSAPSNFGVPAMDINCRCTVAPVIKD